MTHRAQVAAGMRDRLRGSTPRIRRHISVFVDARKATLDTPLKPGARVYVLTAVSGGKHGR